MHRQLSGLHVVYVPYSDSEFQWELPYPLGTLNKLCVFGEKEWEFSTAECAGAEATKDPCVNMFLSGASVGSVPRWRLHSQADPLMDYLSAFFNCSEVST